MPEGKRKTATPIFTYLAIVIVIITIAFGGYSVYQFQRSEENVEGFFTCNEDGTVCELSQHIHADIETNICGQHITFEKEEGRTDEEHTHKETNKIHWHSPLKVSPQTRKPLDSYPLTIAAFFEQMELTLPASCPQNQHPTPSVRVNGLEVPEKLDYVWSDGDIISVEYK